MVRGLYQTNQRRGLDLEIGGSGFGAFLEARAWGVVDGLIFLALATLVAIGLGYLNRITFFARQSIRVRLSTTIVLLFALCGVAYWFGLPALWTIGILLVGMLLLVRYSLSDLSHVGILNVHSSTSKGVSAERSLKLVNKSIAFLGIGAKKLTETKEFDLALRRCKKAGGQVRFLLSDPQNEGLSRLAKGNERSSSSYKSRVRESISEIVHKAEVSGVSCAIKLYRIDNEISLPRFRLMFIDDRVCLFSNVIWNDREGLDNPQMILRHRDRNAEANLYLFYRGIFEDLWNSADSVQVTPELVSSWEG